MREHSLPIHEHKRQAALDGLRILHTPSDARLNSIVQMLCATFQVPVALINLIDQERIWTKAYQGLDFTGARRRDSFCTHAIEQDDILMISDMLTDERSRYNRFVIGPPFLRFYAGLRLKDRQGCAIGTLCALDFRPRTFDEAQCQQFRIFARLIEQHLFTLSAPTP